MEHRTTGTMIAKDANANTTREQGEFAVRVGKNPHRCFKDDVEAGECSSNADMDSTDLDSEFFSDELDVRVDGGQVLNKDVDDQTNNMSRAILIKALLGVMVMATIVIVFVVAGGSLHAPTNGGAEAKAKVHSLSGSPTLDQIKQRGVLRCVSNWDVDTPLSRFDDALCEVIAAAASVEVEFVSSARDKMFLDLQEDRLDLITSVVSHTMELEVFETTQRTNTGFAFSIPYLYGGVRVGGDPFYVACAEDDFNHSNECSDLKVCVDAKSDNKKVLEGLLPDRFIVPYESDQLDTGLLGRDCNVIALSGFCPVEHMLNELSHSSQRQGQDDKVKIGTRYFSKEHYSIATRTQDPVFSDFLNSVLQALLAAEERGIDKEVADLYPYTHLFGPEYIDMFYQAVARFGNFQEVFHHAMPMFSPSDGLNKINNGTTGLLYTHPLGSISKHRGDVPLGPILQGVLDRGELRCGLQTSRPGFATSNIFSSATPSYSGMDVDYCRALAASLFQGDASAVAFVELGSPADGYRLLASGAIDVLAGAEWTLQNDVREPTTNRGYSFTTPYFYRNSGQPVSDDNHQENYSLATRQEDHDWSSFVSWVVSATIHAEAEGINQQDSAKMPEVLLFGDVFKNMFQEAIGAVGSYGQLYARNLEALVVRKGRNLLNANPTPQAQHYVLPGTLE